MNNATDYDNKVKYTYYPYHPKRHVLTENKEPCILQIYIVYK